MTILIGLINGMFNSAVPILLGGLGGTITYYAGMFNIAMEGMLLMGAFFGVYGSYVFKSWEMGVVCAILGSLLLALIFIVFAIGLKTNEFVTGIALNLFAVGLTTYLLRQNFHVKGAFAGPGIFPIPDVVILGVQDIPFLGPILSGQNLLIFVTIACVLLINFLVFKTPYGIRVRAAGYNAACLDTSGVQTSTVRIWALVICGVLCGLGGAFISLADVKLFSENMSAGKGFISLAAIILVGGNPTGIALVSLLFGFMDSLGILLQFLQIPNQFTSMVPYFATLAALFVYSLRLRKKQRSVQNDKSLAT